MKNTYAIFYLTLAFLAAFYSSSAQITPLGDMQASRTNGKLTITVKNNATFGGFFLADMNDSVEVSFYITDDDARNGKYSAKRKSELSGKIQLIFNALDFKEGDALTFHITENLDGGIVKGYVFVDGGYLGTSVTNIDVCPISISCGNGTLSFTFDPSVNLVGPQNIPTPILIFAPGLSNNGTKTPGSINLTTNSLVIRRNAVFEEECGLINNGTVVIVINGHTCVFVNGVLQSDDSVDPFANYTNTQNCSALFDECYLDLLKFLEFNQSAILCRDWIPSLSNNWPMCSTSRPIKNPSRVAIGTEKFSTSNFYGLTVKNGVITDKVKLCKTQWCDYVFAPNYLRPSLPQVAGFIQQNKHLPGMPSAAEIEKEGGFELGDITFRQQEKIEEIFLYLIEEEQEISRLEMVLCVLEWREKLRTF